MRLPILLLLCALFAGGCLSIENEDNRYMDPRVAEKPLTAEERGAADLVIRSFSPGDGYAGPRTTISFLFNEPVDEASVERHLYVGDERNTLVRCQYFFYDLLETSAVLLEMTPLDDLLPGKTYYLNAGAGIASRLGVPLKRPFRSAFIFSETPLPRE